jgi:hypothetical protein
LQAFGVDVQSRLFAVDAHEITRRLLEEATTAFETKGGAVFLASTGDAQPAHVTRHWDGQARLSIPLQRAADAAQLGVVVLGARRHEAEYTEHDRSILQQTVQMVALAIEEDRQAS